MTFRRLTLVLVLIVISLLFQLAGTVARAEVSEVRVAQQYGISFLQLMIMERDRLIEKHAKAAGAGDIKVMWSKFAGGNVMNDALLSGALHFASGGVPPLVTIWGKTHGNLGVKGVAALNSMPTYLLTRNPNVKTIKDFTAKDKIALPAVKVGAQALALQMAAAKTFGEKNYAKLDSLTVSMSHPDALAALLSGTSEVNSHFASAPFHYQALANPGIRTVLTSYDALGGPATLNVVFATSKFREENPKTYGAFLSALEEATATLNKDKRAAAEYYVKATQSKLPLNDVYKMIADRDVEFTMTPQNVMKYAEFMFTVGTIKVRPTSWKDLFFSNIHNLPGS